MNQNNRVVITGMGAASPLGITREDYKRGLIAGKSGVREIQSFDASLLPVHIAAETDLPADFMRDEEDKKVRLISWAVERAMEQACPQGGLSACGSAVVSLGVGLDLFSLARLVEIYRDDHLDIEKLTAPLQFPTQDIVFQLAKKYGATRPPHILVSACAASADALGIAMDEIRTGQADWAIAGGMDSMINPLGFSAFTLLGALSKRNELLTGASCPFDQSRDGFVMGEGAGALILESLEGAKKRGATILGELVGRGNSLDAHGISEPHPEGEGAVLAMTRALQDSALNPENIDYINAHGTSTPKNDVVETLAIRRVFQNPPPVSSTKSMIGHCIASAGVLELLGVFLCQQDGYLPPTINLKTPGDGCDLDYIPQQARKQKIEYFLSNSFAFGGQNTSLAGRIWGACPQT